MAEIIQQLTDGNGNDLMPITKVEAVKTTIDNIQLTQQQINASFDIRLHDLEDLTENFITYEIIN